MKTNQAIQSIIAGLSLNLIPVTAAEPAPAAIGIYIIEDVSGPEVQKHGIKPADFEDMPVLGDVIFIARTTGCATTIKTARRRQLKLTSWEGCFLG